MRYPDFRRYLRARVGGHAATEDIARGGIIALFLRAPFTFGVQLDKGVKSF